MQNKKILIVEDDIDIRESLCDFLTWEEFDVAAVGNGQEALEYLELNEPPAMIFLDLMMPVMDGHELLERLAERYAEFKVPVVVLSAIPYSWHSPLVLDYLKKPFDLDIIAGLITRHTLKKLETASLVSDPEKSAIQRISTRPNHHEWVTHNNLVQINRANQGAENSQGSQSRH